MLPIDILVNEIMNIHDEKISSFDQYIKKANWLEFSSSMFDDSVEKRDE